MRGTGSTRGFAASAKAGDGDEGEKDGGAARARESDASSTSSTSSSDGGSRDESDANERALLRDARLPSRLALKRVDFHGWCSREPSTRVCEI